jgi:hypothetical protein
MCGFPITATTHTTLHATSDALLNLHPHEKGKLIKINYHHVTVILYNSFFKIRKFIPPESNAVGCCNSIITVFHHEHFSVLLRKGKD